MARKKLPKPQAAGTDDPAELVEFELPDFDEDEQALVVADLAAYRKLWPEYYTDNATALMTMLDDPDYLPGRYSSKKDMGR